MSQVRCNNSICREHGNWIIRVKWHYVFISSTQVSSVYYEKWGPCGSISLSLSIKMGIERERWISICCVCVHRTEGDYFIIKLTPILISRCLCVAPWTGGCLGCQVFGGNLSLKTLGHRRFYWGDSKNEKVTFQSVMWHFYVIMAKLTYGMSAFVPWHFRSIDRWSDN